ncbi:MAG: hypothetical protein IJY62_02890 [Clostridia bacterium]|nr:hypothetical protein [Clostridia bacterium]
MNEEIEYAEMLEIPVSTVNVVKKKRRSRAKPRVDLKERLIDKVNDKVSAEPSAPAAAVAATEEQAPVEEKNAESVKGGEPVLGAVEATPETAYAAYGNERIDTVPIRGGGKKKKKSARFSRTGYDSTPEEKAAYDVYNDYGAYAPVETPSESTEEWGRYATSEANGAGNDLFSESENGYESAKRARASRRAGIALTAEFAVACALCGAIFLTNVFMPESAINTFFRSLAPSAEKTDSRVYSDFKLASVVSELSDAEITVSPTGILSFTDACCVYPAVDGEVAEVIKNADGTYDLKIAHTDSFYGVIGGLNHVYYAVGDEVYTNVPVGYSNGETAVRVMMYSGEELLSCYTVDEENCLAWAQAAE